MDIALQFYEVTKEYMNNITSVKGNVNVETIKNDKIVKLP